MRSLLITAQAIAIPDGFRGYFFFRPLAFLFVAFEVLLHVICAVPLLLVVYMPIGLALPHIEYELGQQRHYGGLLARDPEAAEFWYLRAAKPGLFFWETGHVVARRQLGLLYLNSTDHGPLPGKAALPFSRSEEQPFWGGGGPDLGIRWLEEAMKAGDTEAEQELRRRFVAPAAAAAAAEAAASAASAPASAASKP